MLITDISYMIKICKQHVKQIIQYPKRFINQVIKQVTNLLDKKKKKKAHHPLWPNKKDRK